MPVTPDRSPGPSDEEEVVLEDRTSDGDPTVDGAVRFVDDEFRIKTVAGVKELGNALKLLGKSLDATGLVNEFVLRYDLALDKWKAKDLGDAATVANIMQLPIGILAISLGVVYATVTPFIYGGSVDWGTIEKISAVTAQTGGVGKTHSVRVYDATNGLVVAEVTGLSHVVPTVVDLGVISNVPTGLSLFEIQVLRVGAGQSMDFHVLSMQCH